MTGALTSRLHGGAQRLRRVVATGSGDRATLEDLAARLRALHTVVLTPGGVELCEHCCLNRIQQRRLVCSQHHGHNADAAPCDTLAILALFGL